MFNFIVKVYFIGFSKQEEAIIMENKKEFIEPTFSERMIDKKFKETEFIIAKVTDSSLASLIEKADHFNKDTKRLILCMNREFFPKIDMESYYNIWPNDMTEQVLSFLFSKFMEEMVLEHRLFETKEVLETLINSTEDLIWAKDLKGAHRLFNNSFMDAIPSAKDGHRKTKEECYGRGHLFIWELSEEDYAEGEFICMESELDVIKADATLTLDEILMVSSGELRNLVTKKSTVHDKHGNIVGTVGIARDVTMELAYKKLLEKHAYTDTLTGLFNRRYMYDYMEKSADKEFSLLYMDLDNFKGVNDTYGHNKGDEAILLTSKTLSKILDDYIVGRIGGDEFIAIGHDIEKLDDDTERVLAGIAELYDSDPCFSNLHISIGTSVYDPATSNIEEVIHNADTAMYRNKLRGKERQMILE